VWGRSREERSLLRLCRAGFIIAQGDRGGKKHCVLEERTLGKFILQLKRTQKPVLDGGNLYLTKSYRERSEKEGYGAFLLSALKNICMGR